MATRGVRKFQAQLVEPQPRGFTITEILFVVSEAPEGGFVATGVDASIVTEADTLDELREMIRDAVRCHFDEADRPKVIRLHLVRDEVIAA